MTETLPDRTPTGLFVGGQWLTTAAHLDVVNPATLGTLAQIGDATVADGLDAVSAAHGAFATWGVSSARSRRDLAQGV